ncbi:hypothetical protein DFP72DRAFT_123581 [Ephemerocybe angulata]|uniref:Uncharacterized protein n=1 Tax=Ephemerocybe angulata TaxID=980116 RepID=A0A8H6LVD7_9AGAR|nr:hypothetical protein DFP72DRAFT_123581 [Tulosesus angulatus]
MVLPPTMMTMDLFPGEEPPETSAPSTSSESISATTTATGSGTGISVLNVPRGRCCHSPETKRRCRLPHRPLKSPRYSCLRPFTPTPTPALHDREHHPERTPSIVMPIPATPLEAKIALSPPALPAVLMSSHDCDVGLDPVLGVVAVYVDLVAMYLYGRRVRPCTMFCRRINQV